MTKNGLKSIKKKNISLKLREEDGAFVYPIFEHWYILLDYTL